MTSNLPLLKRLEIALSESSSDTQKDTVYFTLYNLSLTVTQYQSHEHFYGQITQKKLSPEYNRKKINNENILKGKSLAESLSDGIILPEMKEQNYSKKIIKCMKAEFDFLNKYTKENNTK